MLEALSVGLGYSSYNELRRIHVAHYPAPDYTCGEAYEAVRDGFVRVIEVAATAGIAQNWQDGDNALFVSFAADEVVRRFQNWKSERKPVDNRGNFLMGSDGNTGNLF
jgi:hypothetical protein